ncbi:MAG: MFS transporter [Thermoleophilia bacterium]
MAVLALAVTWNATNVGAIADAIAVDYGVALATVGLFTTAFFIAHSLVQLPGGGLIDRVGPSRVALAALVIIAVTNALIMLTPEPALALALRVVCGIGTGTGFIATSDYVRATGGGAFMQGVFGGIAMGAGGVALGVVPLVENAIGWRAPFATSAGLALIALVVLAVGPRPGPTRAAGHPPVRLAAVLGDARLYPLALLQMLGFGLSLVAGNWASTLLVRAGDYGEDAAGAIASLVLLGGILTRPLGGWVVRVHPERARLAIGIGLVGGAVGTALIATAGSLALVVPGGILLGLCAGIPFAPAMHGAARLRPDAPAAAVAFVNMMGALTIVAATPLLGLTFSLPGEGRIGFVAVAAIWAIGLLLAPSREQLGVAPARTAT